MYEIRLCRHDELDLLKSFIEESWSNTHVFLYDETVLDFQHKSLEGYNFVVAYHIKTRRFHGVLGLISPGFYIHREIMPGADLWLAIWKVDKIQSESNSLGMDLLDHAVCKYQPKSISAIGINEKVALLYKLMGFKVKKLRHWFVPNYFLATHRLVSGDVARRESGSGSLYFSRLIEGELVPVLAEFLTGNSVKEDFSYLNARYLQHPIYKYEFIGVYNSASQMVALGVGREVYAKNSKGFRLVELFAGYDNSVDFHGAFDSYLQSNSLEYIDFLEYGFDEKVLHSFGFELCTETMYVPHLFEPFLSERKEVLIAYKSEESFSCTKGDSDLDRPNMKLCND